MKKFMMFMCLIIPQLSMAGDTDELYKDIKAVDAAFFEAFNRCDLDTMATLFGKDLEFYHDTGGVSDYTSTLRVTRENCDRKLGLRRELIDGSLSVYPIRDFGAIQKGQHTFCHLENGKDDCGTFEFVHIWAKSESGWRLTRVVSFGH